MSHHSPQSSAGLGPASSPFAGTDPTLYSPQIGRTTGTSQIRQNFIDAMMKPPANKSVDRVKYNMVLPPPAPYVQGAFVNEMAEDSKTYISRFLVVTQLPDGTLAGQHDEHEMSTVQAKMKRYACFSTCVPVYARGVYLRFDDLHDATEAMDILERHYFYADYVSGYDFAVAKGQDTAQVNEFEGQIKLAILFDPNPDHNIWNFTDADATALTKSVEATAEAFGSVRNCVHVETDDTKSLLVYRIEFHSIDAANRAVQSLLADPACGVNKDRTFQWCTLKVAAWTGERAANSPHRHKPRIDAEGRFSDYRPGNHLIQANTAHRHPHDQHNRVRRERILDGSDVRTTIMLRNIPNKLDWLSLKALLDDVCFGTYDFVYLRIDFKSGCNVGYAFINFSDVHGMIALIDSIEGRPWAGFKNCSKSAEISYATIQGREALVQKFRNSSVMQETPFCRPRLFYTYIDADAMCQLRKTGTEQSFAYPDNLSKLQRSMDSARSIGLYPPHGLSNITEHRTRASAYDRGTPRDMMQAAGHFARQRAAPVPVAGLTDNHKRAIETWYTNCYGLGHIGRIPFDYIPLTHVAKYLAQHAGPVPVPGVIGAPVNATFVPGTATGPGSIPNHAVPGPSTFAPRPYSVENPFM
ncbi:hypothetical protein ACN47E_008076 [Coniothyrium glycines]